MASKKPCLIIGDINIDFNIKTDFYPPEGGETHAEESVFRLGGSGCSTALILQKLGLQSTLAANLGDDLFAEFALGHLKKSGLDISFVKKNTVQPTGFFMILITGKAYRTMFGNRGANAIPLPLAIVKSGIDRAQHIHFSGYNLLGEDQAAAMMEVVRYGFENDKTISLDPGIHTCKAVPERVLDMLPFVDYFLPNNLEAEILSGHTREDAQITFLLNRGCKTVILKKGECGSRFTSSHQDLQIPAIAIENQQVQDTTGAGDSFNAGCLYGLLHEKPPQICLQLGNAAGYLMVTAPGGPLEILERENLIDAVESLIP